MKSAAPAISYLLGFSPQNLKIDGRFHALKVTLTSKEKFELQARHGYFAPKTLTDPAESTKLEMQEALFSQEEIRDLPVELQTQFFKKDDAQARLAVLTHFDVKGIHIHGIALPRQRLARGFHLDARDIGPIDGVGLRLDEAIERLRTLKPAAWLA